MDIMELGAIGELVGGVAVVATLVYLAVQIRQGNRAGRRKAYRTHEALPCYVGQAAPRPSARA